MIFTFALSDHPIRPLQCPLWHRDSDLLAGLQLEHQLEFQGSFYGQLGRCGAFENSVRVVCSPYIQLLPNGFVAFKAQPLCDAHA